MTQGRSCFQTIGVLDRRVHMRLRVSAAFRIETCLDMCRSATERTHHLIKQRSFHFHQMAALGEAAFPDVGDVFAEGGEAFRLQAAVFGDVIAVGAGGAGPVCES